MHAGRADVSEFQIEVCSRLEASEILSSTESCAGIALLISIGEWIDAPPPGYEKVTTRLRLTFADTGDAHSGASEQDVQRIIEAARILAANGGRAVVHCQAGVSRSSAAALILYAAALGPGHEAEALERVLEQRPIARPNARMVEIADRLLGSSGRLTQVVREFLEGDFGRPRG